MAPRDTPFRRRATQIYEGHLRAIHMRTDRIFVVLMIVQWVAGIVFALTIAPETWIGLESDVHLHVWCALYLGAVLAVFPILLACKRPGDTLTRHVIAVSQVLFSALLIHLTGGRIETHFHVFGSLAFLAFYRDVRVLLTATAVVTADHWLRGVFWPQSVFGVLAADSWRWLEHAAWVVFIDIFLIGSCRRALADLRSVSWRAARSELTKERIAQQVERRTAELREVTARARMVFETAADGIVTFDDDGAVKSVNPAAARLFDLEGRLLHQLDVRELLPGLELDGLRECARAAIEGAPAPLFAGPMDLVARTAEGEDFPCELSVGWSTVAPEPMYTATIRDMTEHKQHEAELRAAKTRAEEATTAKSRFLANMSHELRTPMNGVMGMADALAGTSLDEQQRDYVETICRSGGALLTVIDDVLDFSKIEAGMMQLDPRAFDLELLTEDVACLLASQAASKGVQLIVRCLPRTPRHLVGDAGRIRQILLNLVGNAVKFTETGHVVITVQGFPASDERGRARVRLSVDDTGIGIPPAGLGKLFRTFQQADASTTRRFGGTGLGLAISRRLTELMGGEIGASSHPGRGSTFWVNLELPIASGAQRSALPTREPVDLREGKVLLLDPYRLSAQVLDEAVRSANAVTHCVASEAEAVDELRRAATDGVPYDVVVLSCGPSGADVELGVRLLAADSIGRPRIVAVGLGRSGMAVRTCADAGFAAFLEWPVRHSDLLPAIATVLRQEDGFVTRHALRARDSREGIDRDAEPLRARILVAEDNPVNQKVAQSLLQRLGCEVVVVADGREAVERVAEGGFDLVFMDCQMPVMDGYDAVRAIRVAERTGSRLPIVALTASVLTEDRERCAAAGMDDHTSKPVSLDALRKVLERWLAPVDPPHPVEGAGLDPRGIRGQVSCTTDPTV